MVGKESSESFGVVVSGRAAVSETQPVANPPGENGFFSTAVETCRTVASDRIGEIAVMRRPISPSVSVGSR